MSTTATAIDWLRGGPLGSNPGLPELLVRWWPVAAMHRRWAGTPSAREGSAGIEAAVGDDDSRDVRESLAGDGDAYGRLVRRHQHEIASYMWRFTRDRVQWEELVHEVFVEAYFSLRTYRAQAPLSHWLRRIATRVGYRWWKQAEQRRRQAAWSPEAWQQLAEADPRQVEAEEAAEAVHRLLGQMAPRDRLVLTLLYLEQCSVAQTASLTGWSQTMVKVQAHRARQRLKRLLEGTASE